LTDWKAPILERIEAIRSRVAALDLTGARARLTASQSRAADLIRQHNANGQTMTMVHHSVVEAGGAEKQARQALQRVEEQSRQLEAEIKKLEGQLQIPERLAAAQAASDEALGRVSAAADEVQEAEGVHARLRQQLQDTRAALEHGRQLAGARMLEAAKAGTAAEPAETKQLFAQLDAIEMAMVAAEIELEGKRAAHKLAKEAAGSAVHAVHVIAAESTEVALSQFEEEYVERLAQHQAAVWRAHRAAFFAPNLTPRVSSRAQQLLAEPQA